MATACLNAREPVDNDASPTFSGAPSKVAALTNSDAFPFLTDAPLELTKVGLVSRNLLVVVVVVSVAL